MRAVNTPLLGILALSSAILGTTAYVVHGYQVTRNAGALLREANGAKERKDWSTAISYLERYVALVPDENAGALADLGMLQADVNRSGEAYRTLEAALRRDAARNDVRRRLAELAIRINRYPDALHHVNYLLKENPNDAELLVLLAQSHVGMEDLSSAAEDLTRATELAPDRVEYASQLADLLQTKLHDPERAISVLDSMVERNPENHLAYVLRGEHRLDHLLNSAASKTAQDDTDSSASSEKPDAATEWIEASVDDARKARELAPEDERVLVLSVRCLIATEQVEEAEELVRRGLTLHSRNVYLYGLIAELELKKENRKDAIAWLEKGIQAVPNNPDLHWNLADLLVDEGRIDDAQDIIKRLRELGYPLAPLAYLEARCLVRQGQWFDGSKRLEGLRGALIEWPELSKQANYHLGECYRQLGRTDLQLTAFRRAIAIDSRWIPARLGAASALLTMGRIEEALEEYRVIAVLPKPPAAVLAQLARLLILKNIGSNPSEQNWTTPQLLLDRLEGINPDSVAVPILRAETYFAQGDVETAEETLLAARDSHPDVLEYWLALIALAERRDDSDKVERLLTQAEESNGDQMELRLARARHLVYRHKGDAKDRLRQLGASSDQFDEDDRIALYSGLAASTLAIGDFVETERLCKLVAAAQPTNLRIRLLLFDLAHQAKRIDAMQEELDHVQEIERSGPLWNYGEAVRLTVLAKAEGKPELFAKAKEHLALCRNARPLWSRVPMLLAHIHDAQGEEDEAILNYTQAITLGERDPAAVSRALSLLYRRRQYAEADRLIRVLQEQQSPFSLEMLQLATAISLRLNDDERALALVLNANSDSDKPSELVWSGRILSALGKADEAEKRLLQAVELDRASPEAWIALIQHYGRTFQPQKAEHALAEAERSIPADRAPQALGEALESIGRLEEAEAMYKSVVAKSPQEMPNVRRLAEFYIRQRKPNEAEPLLQSIVSTTGALTDDDRVWAQRHLALILMSRGNRTSLNDALKLVEDNLSRTPTSEQDRLAKAMILAGMPERDTLTESAELFEKLLAAQRAEGDKALAEPRFILAQVYLRLGEPSKAMSHLQRLMAAHGDEPRYLTFYIRFLLSRREISEAELWLNRLRKLEPHELNTVTVAAEVFWNQQRYDALLALVEKFVTDAEKDPALKQQRWKASAALLEKYARGLLKPDEATSENPGTRKEWADRYLQRSDEWLHALVEERRDNVLQLAAFYGRSGRHTESLDLLEENIAAAKPEDIVAVTAAIPTSSAATKEHYARAKTLLTGALERYGRQMILLLALADLQNWLGEYDDAERLYREALQKQEQNPAALNNLALLLALRGRGGDEPLALINKALNLVGLNPSLLDTRAAVHLARGDLRLAANDLTQALSLHSSAESQFRLALIEIQLGKLDEARESFAKALAMGIRIDRLHPLEQPTFRQLQNELR